MEEVERTDPDPPPTLAGTHSGAPLAARELPTRGTEIGRYLVTGEIGRGAMGAVLAAYDADLDRKVAIKLIGERLDADGERRHRLLGEAKSMARITHPNVVTVYDAGVWHDRLWVAMELVDGVTLDRWRADEARSLASIVETFVAAARGLAAAHDAGVLHGDFKPSNVLVSRSGRVVVADFGLANRIDAPKPSESALGAPIGTPAYMSPEHFLAGVVDARADQFAFCVALFEQLTGERPFKGRSLLELASAISAGTVAVAAAAKIPMRVRAIVMRGLASQPSDRFASMHELIAALQSAVRPRWPWALAIGGVAVVAALAAWVVAHDDERACTPGSERVQEIWSADARAAVRVQGDGTSAAVVEQRTARLRSGIDEYFGEWARLYDEACNDGAGASTELAQQARTACLENRFDAGRGFVELLGREAIAVARVDALLDALPPLSHCRGPAFGRWEPMPSDPELAREVASLRLRLDQTRLMRRAGHVDAVAPEVAAVLAAARASGLSHVVAEALLEQAAVMRAFDDEDGAEAAVDEALDVALRDGHDFVAANAINRRLLLMQQDFTTRKREAVQWARLGEALYTRAGAGSRNIGDLANNLGILLRNMGDQEASLVQCRRAEQLYAAELGPDARPTIGARVNCGSVLIELFRYDEAEELLRASGAQYDELLGREHPDAITVAWNRAHLELVRGDRHEALAIGRDALARQLGATGPHGRAARTSFIWMSHLQAALGEIAPARESLVKARAAYEVDERNGYDLPFAMAAIEAHAAEYARAIELYSQVIANPHVGPKLRDRAQLHRAELYMIVGDDAAALADVSPLCRDRAVGRGDFSPLYCYAIGALAEVARGDRLAATKWLAWSEAAVEHDVEERGLRRLLHTVVGGRMDAASIASLRTDRDVLAQRGHPDHPSARLFDRWLTPSDTNAPGGTDSRLGAPAGAAYPRPPVLRGGHEAR
ncbi:MAG TPA: serine/threonine-protein kinase [Nannocystaceae bacterium]|nr:serine/threonine-protein kinase [Nannocystaceae bacterium]